MKLTFLRRSTRPRYSLAILAILALIAAVVSACGTPRSTKTTPTPTLTVTATFPPTLTPTPQPLGTDTNPFVIGLVSENQDPQVDASAVEVARQAGQASGKKFSGQVFISYAQLLESMADGRVHAAWMPPLTYLYASQNGLAEVIILTNHFGVYQYGSQFLANISSGLTPYYDPISGLNSADAATALSQFQDLRPCWVDPQSASGYILPAGLLRTNDIAVQPAVVAQSHTAVVRALYVKGICDFGATFSISGDPRTASAVQDDLPDVMNRIMIVWRTEASIPNLNLSVLAGMSEADRQILTNAFLDIAKSPEGRALLMVSAEGYEIEEMKPVQDTIYDPLREMVHALDLNLKEMIGK